MENSLQDPLQFNETEIAVTPDDAKGINDLGRKIGGARKDRIAPTRKKTQSNAQDPPKEKLYYGKYHLSQEDVIDPVSGERHWKINSKDDCLYGFYLIGSAKRTYPNRESAEKAIPLLAVNDKHAIRHRTSDAGEIYVIVRTVGEGKSVRVCATEFDSLQSAQYYMANNAKAILETVTTFGETDLPNPTAHVRYGPKIIAGKPSAPDFMYTFKLSSIEFGNWNKQKERELVLDAAFHALADLAQILGLDKDKIGLFGELSLAFGSRGQGLAHARAHYEPEKVVINLTKMKGSGSLAHEWMHALDNTIAKICTKTPSDWLPGLDTTLYIPFTGNTRAYASHGLFGRMEALKPDLCKVYRELMQMLSFKKVQYKNESEKAAEFLSKTQDYLDESIAQIREILTATITWKVRNSKPANEAQLAQFELLSTQIKTPEGLHLKGTVVYKLSKSPATMQAPFIRRTNDVLEAINAIMKEVRGSEGFQIEKTGVLDVLVQRIDRYCERKIMLEKAHAGAVETKMVPTDFAMAATSLDQARTGPYWKLHHEMVARAFSAYIEDRLSDNGQTNTYLNYAPESAVINTPFGMVAPYPQGEERLRFNAQFDKLFDVLRKELEGKLPHQTDG